MAALLKKRALAEYSYVIQEEPVPVKKLRLVQKAPLPEVHVNLQSATSSHEALLLLLKFESSLPIDGEAANGVVGELLDHYAREKEPVIRCKVISVLGQLSRLPGFNTEIVVDTMLVSCQAEKSHKVWSQLLHTLGTLGLCQSLNAGIRLQLVELARQHLSDPCHTVRSASLNMIGCLGSVDHKQSSGVAVDLQSLLADFTHDQDPRVRTSAFHAMLLFHERGIQLDIGIYQQACAALKDDFEDVRDKAIKLMWVLSHLYPESSVPIPDSSEDLRLIDDAFAKICNMVNDISVKVKVQAANVLGSLHLVSPKFLEQTLDKKLMSSLRRKKSAHERARDLYQSGEWSTGQKWADDAPREEVNPESISLMAVGSCGAFVHGLEDEFLEVRNATLDSLCELAAQSPVFAHMSQDSIIDMFNDEIDSVRLNAISSLKKISQHIAIRQDQLEIILGVLQDFSFETRETLRDMLGDMRLSTKDCLNDCITALLENLTRYPQDRLSVWKCARNLGRNHPPFTLTLAPVFLCIHPYFNTPEPNMDDPAYITILLLIFNAATDCPTLIPLFQDHIVRHYTYLRNSIPDLVPILKALEGATVCTDQDPVDSSKKMSTFLRQTVNRLSTLHVMDNSTAQQLLEITVRDLQRIAELDSSVSSSAECICLFLQSQLILTRLLSQMKSSFGGLTASDNILAPIDKILQLTTKLQTVYMGITTQELGLIRQTELKALTLQLRVTLSKGSLFDQFRASESYMQYLRQFSKFTESSDISTDTFTSRILSSMGAADANKLNTVRNLIQSAMPLVCISSFPLTCQIRKATVTVHEPPQLSEIPIKFAAGLTAAIPVDATVENIANIQDIKIQVRYPDQQLQVVTPRHTDFKKLGPLRHRLLTNVLISHALWSESCHVELTFVMESVTQGKQLRKQQDLVELCKPVKVLVSTKAAKRS
ncbi:integrator complex subunit 4-like [Gigantopelta aegis]|uniref:integrator complex subunit 4-like n=1 Tax=Gigantopelta aegis TaxID=1735272 RepID=UPI001B88BE83|nr:integrator complex subunit 4-like [Gigantopelta aegis]